MSAPTVRSIQRDVAPVWIVSCLTALIVGVAIAYFWCVRSQDYDGDSGHYIAIAEGRVAEVRQPFTSRVLHPAVAGFVSRTTGLSLDAAFFLMNVISLAVLVSAGMIFILGRIRSLRLAMAILLTPMTLFLFREIYMPDCMHAALAAVFFLLLARGAWLYAVPLLFLMQVTRESTILLTFFVVLAAAYQGKWKLAVTAILFTALGMGVVSRAAHRGLGNIHESNTLVYLVAKVPFNLVTNITGLRTWTDTHAKNDPAYFHGEPMFSFDLPDWLPRGAMRQMGIYNWDPDIPLMVFRIMLAHLGIIPAVVFAVIVWKRWRLVRDDGLSLIGIVALTYGVASYLLIPCLGTAISRYISYAWPLAWIAAPELLARYYKTSDQLIVKLTWLQVIVSWMPLLRKLGVASMPLNIMAIAVALPCHIIAIKLLRQNRITHDDGDLSTA